MESSKLIYILAPARYDRKECESFCKLKPSLKFSRREYPLPGAVLKGMPISYYGGKVLNFLRASFCLKLDPKIGARLFQFVSKWLLLALLLFEALQESTGMLLSHSQSLATPGNGWTHSEQCNPCSKNLSGGPIPFSILKEGKEKEPVSVWTSDQVPKGAKVQKGGSQVHSDNRIQIVFHRPIYHPTNYSLVMHEGTTCSRPNQCHSVRPTLWVFSMVPLITTSGKDGVHACPFLDSLLIRALHREKA